MKHKFFIVFAIDKIMWWRWIPFFRSDIDIIKFAKKNIFPEILILISILAVFIIRKKLEKQFHCLDIF